MELLRTVGYGNGDCYDVPPDDAFVMEMYRKIIYGG